MMLMPSMLGYQRPLMEGQMGITMLTSRRPRSAAGVSAMARLYAAVASLYSPRSCRMSACNRPTAFKS